jgi:tetratricopeptide (TPR) repeat protein
MMWSESRKLTCCWGLYERQGNYSQAIEQFQDGIATYTELGDIRNRAYCKISLGCLYHNRGDRAAAIQQYDTAGNDFEQARDERGKALVSLNLAIFRQEKGEWREAAEMYARAIEIFERTRDSLSQAQAMTSRSSLSLQRIHGSAESVSRSYAPRSGFR